MVQTVKYRVMAHKDGGAGALVAEGIREMPAWSSPSSGKSEKVVNKHNLGIEL